MRTKFVFVIGFVAALSAAVPNVSEAGFFSGSQLMDWINGEQRIDSGSPQNNDYQRSANLIGYVAGVSDTLDGKQICVPDNVTMKQAIGIVEKYMRDNPDKWNLPASILVENSLRQVFPCAR